MGWSCAGDALTGDQPTYRRSIDQAIVQIKRKLIIIKITEGTGFEIANDLAREISGTGLNINSIVLSLCSLHIAIQLSLALIRLLEVEIVFVLSSNQLLHHAGYPGTTPSAIPRTSLALAWGGLQPVTPHVPITDMHLFLPPLLPLTIILDNRKQNNTRLRIVSSKLRRQCPFATKQHLLLTTILIMHIKSIKKVKSTNQLKIRSKLREAEEWSITYAK